MIIDLHLKQSADDTHAVRIDSEAHHIASTPSLREATRLATLEATDCDRAAFVRIHVGTPGPGGLSFTTEPTALLFITVLLMIVHHLSAAAHFAADCAAGLRCALATRGDYDGASYRLTIPDADAHQQPASVTCLSCRQPSEFDTYRFRGPCNKCGKPTCDLCNDGNGHCLDCAPAPLLEGTPAHTVTA